jgi:hypothetical protein
MRFHAELYGRNDKLLASVGDGKTASPMSEPSKFYEILSRKSC